MDTVEMPDRLAENLVMFIWQKKGTLSKRPREGEFDTGHHELQRRARSHPALQQCPLLIIVDVVVIGLRHLQLDNWSKPS
jgi:hypothetical protein